MLQAFKQIHNIANRLEIQINNNNIKDFRISLKADMRVEIFIRVDNNSKTKSEIRKYIITEQLRFSEIEINIVTENDINFDPLYSHIFSESYPNLKSKIDFGLVWRFDTLLSNDNRTEKEETPCNIATFYSYKGGMGRTTTLCTYAMHLAQQGKKVVIIDCDFEAPGFLNFFNTNKEQENKNGLVEYLLDKEFLGRENLSIKDNYLINVSSDYSGQQGDIFVLQSGNLSYADIETNNNTSEHNDALKVHLYHYIHCLARLNIANTQEMVNHFKELFDDLVKELKLTKDDYILIDSRTGFNEIFGLTALNLSDLIVGFFGSSEQTKAGLYFLLDKYQQLTPQPKLFLINSILPDDEDIYPLFKDRFENILKEYDREKINFNSETNQDWSILGAFQYDFLRENPVLRKMGISFPGLSQSEIKKLQEQNENLIENSTNEKINISEYEANKEEEYSITQKKELVQLINDNIYKKKGVIKKFEDLSRIFNQLDSLTMTLPQIQLNTLDAIELRSIILTSLNNLLKEENDNGNITLSLWAENTTNIEPKTFLYRSCMKTLFQKEKFIINGFKGSGKTYIYKSLTNSVISKLIIEKSGMQKRNFVFIDIIALSKDIVNHKEFPFSKEEISLISNIGNFWKIYLWSSIMLDIRQRKEFKEFRKEFPSNIEKDIIKLSDLIGQNRKSFFIEYLSNLNKIGEVDNDLRNLNFYLEKHQINLFVLFDTLDRISYPKDWHKIITPLVDFWTDNLNKKYFSHFYPKIFIRNDILNGHIRTNNPRSIRTEYSFSIDWSKDEMYAYFFQLVFAENNSQRAFFQTMKNYKEIPINTINEIEKNVKTDGQLQLNPDHIKPLLNTFFGNSIKSPKGTSLGDPYTFFFLNFSNADDSISIRPFINLISGAVQKAIKDKNNKKYIKPLLHYIYSTDNEVRDKATQQHFEDLTVEAGQELEVIFSYIKNHLRRDDKLKSVVITFDEMDRLLGKIMKSDEYRELKDSIKEKNELKKLMERNGIVLKEDRYKIYRFAQMYKYWLGLTSRREDTIYKGQKIKNRVVSLKNGYGFIATGYKSPNLYFYRNDLIGIRFDELKIDDLVEFTVSKNEKGLCATDVRKI